MMLLIDSENLADLVDLANYPAAEPFWKPIAEHSVRNRAGYSQLLYMDENVPEFPAVLSALSPPDWATHYAEVPSL